MVGTVWGETPEQRRRREEEEMRNKTKIARSQAGVDPLGAVQAGTAGLGAAAAPGANVWQQAGRKIGAQLVGSAIGGPFGAIIGGLFNEGGYIGPVQAYQNGGPAMGPQQITPAMEAIAQLPEQVQMAVIAVIEGRIGIDMFIEQMKKADYPEERIQQAIALIDQAKGEFQQHVAPQAGAPQAPPISGEAVAANRGGYINMNTGGFSWSSLIPWFKDREAKKKKRSKPLPASYQSPTCLLYTSPSPRDRTRSRMPSSA